MKKALALVLGTISFFGYVQVVQCGTTILDPSDAFKLSSTVSENGNVVISYKIERGYYLYKDKFKFEILSGKIKVDRVTYSESHFHEDEFFGYCEIFRDELRIKIDLTGKWFGPFTMFVEAQGCADSGVCFLPFSSELGLFRVGN